MACVTMRAAELAAKLAAAALSSYGPGIRGRRTFQNMINRRDLLANASVFALMGTTMARAAIDPPARPGETNWLHYANDLSSTRYSPLDQINAGNFDKLELAWRFSTNALGPRL